MYVCAVFHFSSCLPCCCFFMHVSCISDICVFLLSFFFFFFKQKTAYEMRISDWSSDVCSSDLLPHGLGLAPHALVLPCRGRLRAAARRPRSQARRRRLNLRTAEAVTLPSCPSTKKSACCPTARASFTG